MAKKALIVVDHINDFVHDEEPLTMADFMKLSEQAMIREYFKTVFKSDLR